MGVIWSSKSVGCYSPVTTVSGVMVLPRQQTATQLRQSTTQQSLSVVVSCRLRFISDFLATLTPDTRKALATVARLESYKKDQVGWGAHGNHVPPCHIGVVAMAPQPPGHHGAAG